jgi:hypothetical protein
MNSQSKKRFALILLSLILVCLSLSSALATDYTPSKGSNDLAGAVDENKPDGTQLPPEAVGWHLWILLEDDNISDIFLIEKAKIEAFNATLRPIIYYFDSDLLKPQDLLAKFAALLPSGYDMEKFELLEFHPLGQYGYVPALGDISVTWEFPTQYKIGQQLLGIIGFADHYAPGRKLTDDPKLTELEYFTWHPLAATVVQHPLLRGKTAVRIDFKQEILMLINEYKFIPVAFGILSEKQ